MVIRYGGGAGEEVKVWESKTRGTWESAVKGGEPDLPKRVALLYGLKDCCHGYIVVDDHEWLDSLAAE